MFLSNVSNIGKYNTKSDSEYSADADHGEEPPSVDGHQRNGHTREQNSH